MTSKKVHKLLQKVHNLRRAGQAPPQTAGAAALPTCGGAACRMAGSRQLPSTSARAFAWPCRRHHSHTAEPRAPGRAGGGTCWRGVSGHQGQRRGQGAQLDFALQAPTPGHSSEYLYPPRPHCQLHLIFIHVLHEQ
jgi:hypothetical protein